MKSQKPYLSVVLAVRNDNYGGDFISRLQKCIEWNTNLLEKYKLRTEIILVNWNPIKENKSIKESINWISNPRYVSYRIITVSKDIHNSLYDLKIRKPVPLYEYLAKNVGVYRSKGEFILCLNPDILIPEKLVKKISRRTLKKNISYTSYRLDFNSNQKMPNEESIKKNSSRLFLKGFAYKVSDTSSFTLTKYKVINSSRIFFQLYIMKWFGFLFNILGWKYNPHNVEFKYHTNNGDFIMTHRNHWFELNGFNEDTFIALHTDALFIVRTIALGNKEYSFRPPIYHQEHSRRYDSNKSSDEYRSQYLFFHKESKKLLNGQNSPILENKNWGLSNFDLPEITF